jgi:hypothetical protein
LGKNENKFIYSKYFNDLNNISLRALVSWETGWIALIPVGLRLGCRLFDVLLELLDAAGNLIDVILEMQNKFK